MCGWALAPVEEAGLVGELVLVTGAAVHREAPLKVGVDQLVRVQLQRVRRQEVQLDSVEVIGEPDADLAGAGARRHLPVEVASKPAEEAAHDVAGEVVGEHHEVHPDGDAFVAGGGGTVHTARLQGIGP